MRKTTPLLLLALLCGPITLAAPPNAAASSKVARRAPFPLEELKREHVTYAVLLLHPAAPRKDMTAAARTLLEMQFKGLHLATDEKAPLPNVAVSPLPTEELEPVEAEALRYFGRGFDAGQARALLGARHATLLVFQARYSERYEALKESTRFAHALAGAQGAFLYDTETREYFTPASWKERRLDGWKGRVPYVPAHIVYHLYQDGEGLRAISLGMAKLGLPDLVIENVPRALSEPLGSVLNATGQLLAEGLVPGRDGTLPIALARMQDARLRAELQKKVSSGAKGATQLFAAAGRHDEGDPENALLEVVFPGADAGLQERQFARVSELFGAYQDQVRGAPDDDAELAVVAQKARTRLGELKPVFQRGLAPGAELVVKAGFPTDDGGTEWMWFELTSWEGHTLRGKLLNTPRDIQSLRMGSAVKVALEQVGDYLYRHGDGNEEGNESGRILMRRQGQ